MQNPVPVLLVDRRQASFDASGIPFAPSAIGFLKFIGSLAIGASFIVSTEVGIITWIAAVAHEIPQQLGDFGILIRGGWGRLQALVVLLTLGLKRSLAR